MKRVARTCTFGLMLAVTLGCPNYGVPGLLGTNPGSAGAFSVMASTGERQPKPNRACPWNTFRALARVIFGSNARFYMRSEAARGAVMLAVSGPEWAPQDADGQNFSELEL